MFNSYFGWTISQLEEEYRTKFENTKAFSKLNEADSLCKYFCPPKEECKRRIEQNYDMEFEKEILVKMYERSVAGKQYQEYENVRDITTLELCVNYLFNINITEKSYNFIDNRLRSIRVDLECLNEIMFDDHFKSKKIQILEQICRFYIISLYIFYKIKKDLYQIKEQLKKTCSTLVNNYKACSVYNDEFIGYWITLHVDQADFNIVFYKDFKTYLYTQRQIRLYTLYICKDYKKLLREVWDFMTYSILLCFIDQIQKDLLHIFRTGLNEKISLTQLNLLSGIDMENVVNAFYYDIDQDMVDFKIKNSKNKEIEQIDVPVYKNIQGYLKKGNWDYQLYLIILKKYLTLCISKVAKYNNWYNTIVLEWYKSKIVQIVVSKYLEVCYAKIVQYMNHNLVVQNNNRFNVLKTIYKYTLRHLLFKIIVKKWYKIRFYQILYNCLVIEDASYENINLYDIPFFYDIVEFYKFDETYFTKYNIFIFLSSKKKYMHIIRDNYWFLNYLTITSNKLYTNIKYNNLTYKNTYFNCNSLHQILNTFNILHCKKVRKIHLSSLTIEAQIIYLIQNKKTLKVDINKIIHRIINNEPFDMIIYY